MSSSKSTKMDKGKGKITAAASSTAASAASGVVPESAIKAVNDTLAYLKVLKPQIEQMAALATPEAVAQLDPVRRAKLNLMFAEATTAMFALKLRCQGIDPDDHRIKSEIERINVYKEKYDKCVNQSKEPLRPTTVLNRQAATRVIEHSLPDLSSAQKQSMRGLSKGEKSRIRSETTARKRKYQSNDKQAVQSVQSAAKEFLEKAALEINGNNGGLKGPLMSAPGGSDDTEMGTA